MGHLIVPFFVEKKDKKYYNIIMNRIKELVKYIYPYKKIADIGCDHGYLIIEAFETLDIESAIAVDNKIGPLSSAKNNILGKPYESKIRFSLSSGISDIDLDTECVIIAGMGGMLICDILSDNLKNVKRLILQANRDIKDVRLKVANLGYKIVQEEVIFEKDKYYEILVCDKSNEIIKYNELELEFGPILSKEKSEMFEKKWAEEIKKLENANSNRIKELEEKIERIKSVL